jgi:hypothetical protein
LNKTGKELMGIDRVKILSEIDLFIFISGFESSRYKIDVSNGMNGIFCGIEECGCETIDYVIESKEFLSSGLNTFCIVGGDYDQGVLNVEDKEFSYVSDGSGEKKIRSTVTSGSLFVISGGSISVSSVTLIRDSSVSVSCALFTKNGGGTLSVSTCTICADTPQSGNFSEPFFCVNGGITTLNGVTVGGVNLEGVTFMSGSCSLNLVSCGFTGVNRKNGNGVVFEGTLGISTTLTINECTFTSCEDISGSGGGVHISSGSGRMISITNTTFISCKGNTGCGKGGGIYLSFVDNTDPTFTLNDVILTTNDAKYGKRYVYIL